MERKKRTLIGTAVSAAKEKTALVAVARARTHSRYLKQYRNMRILQCHDEKNRAMKGDTVLIEETRPLSKEKRWKIVKIITKITNSHSQ